MSYVLTLTQKISTCAGDRTGVVAEIYVQEVRTVYRGSITNIEDWLESIANSLTSRIHTELRLNYQENDLERLL